MLSKRNTSHTQRHGHEREDDKRPAKTLAWPLVGKTDLRPKLIQSDKAVSTSQRWEQLIKKMESFWLNMHQVSGL